MKLTVLACLALASAAHGQTSGVTIYGLIDVSTGRSETGSGTTLPSGTVAGPRSQKLYRVDSGLSYGSRLGFKGIEDLGGGLTARFQLEMGIALDTGGLNQGGLAFGRQSWVGVAGQDWSLSAGRQYPLMTYAIGASEALAGGMWGSVYGETVGIYDQIGSTPGNGSFQSGSRIDNSLLATKTIGPVTGYAMIGAGNENTRGTGRYWSFGAKYDDGPLKAYAVAASVRQNAEQIIASATPEWQNEWMIGGTYDFGPVAVYTGYFQFNGPKNKANLAPVATLGATGANAFAFSWDKNKVAWLGVKVPFTLGALIIQGARETYPYAGQSAGNSTLFGVAYEYYLSKRTTTYVTYGQIQNNARANTPMFGAIPVVGPSGFGADPRALSVGVRHSF